MHFYSKLSQSFLIAILLLMGVRAEVSADSGKLHRFQVELINLSNYDLSPGGFVVHNSSFALYETGQPALQGVATLCETGTTADFVFYSKGQPGVRNSFAFHGGAAAMTTATGVMYASSAFSHLSVLHKVSLSDDTCVAVSAVDLFDENGSPRSLVVELVTIDAGTMENLRHPAAKLSWSEWLGFSPTLKRKKTNPPAPVTLSPLIKESPLARIAITPLTAQ